MSDDCYYPNCDSLRAVCAETTCCQAADEIERLRARTKQLEAILKGSEEDYAYLFDDDEEE
jgi:hypothetical protein